MKCIIVLPCYNEQVNINSLVSRIRRSLALRLGLGEAIKCSSNEDVIITMDADNTHDPRYIIDMVKDARKADIVVGSRYVRNGRQLNVPFYRLILSKIVNVLIRVTMKLPVMDGTSSYRCYTAVALKRLSKITKGNFIESKGFEVSPEILAKTFWCNSVIKERPIVLDYSKKHGKSKMRLLPTVMGYVKFLMKTKALRSEIEVDD